jgi:hypothetical protein
LSKKVLIMPSAEERERAERSEGRGATQATPGSGDAPLTPSGFRDLAAVIDIFRTLGGISVLETTSKSHAQKIEQLNQQVSAIPNLEKNVAQNTEDLNKLGERHTNELNRLGQRLDREISDLRTSEIGDLKSFVSTAKILGYIALTLAGVIGAAVAGYLFRK